RHISWDRCLLRVTKEQDLSHAAHSLSNKEIDRMRAYGEEVYFRYLTEDSFANVIRDAYATPAPSSAFTYRTFPPGQLGDRLLQYVKAKWLAYQYNLPFIYQPFKRAEEFLLDELEDHTPLQFKKIVSLKSEKEIDPSARVLYEVDLLFQAEGWGEPNEIGTWKNLLGDTRFRSSIRKRLMPKAPCSQLILPKDAITVAVHVRKGALEEPPLYSEQIFNSYDKDAPPPDPNLVYADIKWPLKFPPSQYYIDQIKNLSYEFDHRHMYVQLFTDAEYPQLIMQEIKTGVDLDNISYAVREKGAWNEHILDDLFAMTQFDCLIRSASHYSQIAHLIGDFKKVIFPKRSFWAGKKLIVLAH
ncbi:MAG: hypothetical protein KBC64_08080, partial [Simkaniaceae bacterium]|nr:hypothetical protein [Simkaniaceae bacterium]